jgi:hypothetical protein
MSKNTKMNDIRTLLRNLAHTVTGSIFARKRAQCQYLGPNWLFMLVIFFVRAVSPVFLTLYREKLGKNFHALEVKNLLLPFSVSRLSMIIRHPL